MDSSGPYRSQNPSGAPREGRLLCPGCTREVEDSLRTCPHCGVPIATVRCADCFHMNPPSAVLCLGCGRELGLEPVGEPDRLSCPDCKQPFQRFSGGPGELHDCSTCGGQLVDHALLMDLLEQRELYGKNAPRRPARHNPLESPMRYVPCPACGDIMARRNFGGNSGVIVDVCRKHGVWFDRGELPRVLAFVEAGGLELARQRDSDSERSVARKTRLREIEKQLEGLHQPVRSSRFGAARRQYEMTQASLSLWGLLSDVLKDR
jgi:Zn-finger nucleic acid-binding protein